VWPVVACRDVRNGMPSRSCRFLGGARLAGLLGALIIALAAVSAAAAGTPDTVPPGPPILTVIPPTVTQSTRATIGFLHLEPDVTFMCKLDGSSAKLCASPRLFSGLANGSHSFVVYAVDVAGNAGDATPATATWRVDATATIIDQMPPLHSNTRNAEFGFSSTTPPVTFECSLDGGIAGGPAFAPCTSPAAYANLSDDAHVFIVRAIGGPSQSDPTPAAWRWEIDTVAPVTTLISAPVGTIAGRDAALEFSTNEPGAGFECKVNTGQYSSCASPLILDGLRDGDYTIVVRAVDAASNVDPHPVVTRFAVDMPPDTVLVAGPIGLIDSSDATFVFGGTTASDRFECSLNGGSFLPCPSVHNVVGLAPGEHVLAVRAVDIGGERDPTPVSAPWTVVTLAAAPATFAANVRKARVKAGDHRATLSWKRPGGKQFRRVEIVRIPGKKNAARSLVYRGNKIAFVDRGLKNGVEHRWVIYATDKAGNRSGGVEVSTTPPVRTSLGRRAKVTPQTPLVLWWKPVKKARFYNLQLFRGQKKVLSSWPANPSVSLSGQWNWEGGKRKLLPGVYRWFVWPGFGKRKNSNFGKLVGSGTVVVKKPKVPKKN
jgi:hypothetical protein